MVASADILTVISQVDLAAANMPIQLDGDASHLANRGIIEGIRLAAQIRIGEGNVGDVLGSPSAELWQEERSTEERLAAVTGLFLGALAAHKLEIEA
jgi:hypothetical protein